MLYFCAFYNAQIRLQEFFDHPEIAEHLSMDTIKRHAVFPAFGNTLVLAQDMFPEEQQSAFYRLFLAEEIMIDGAQHRSEDREFLSALRER